MHDTVYHYTSPDGILGILKNKTLRFTDCQYLNDVDEFVYFWKPFEKAWEQAIKDHGKFNDDIEQIVDLFHKSPYEEINLQKCEYSPTHIINLEFVHNRYYVLCASTNPDTANMWNYYVKNGVYHGYNLGIDCDYINQWFNNYHVRNNQVVLFSNKVIYNEKKQIEIIYKKIMEMLTKHSEREDEIASSSIQKDDKFQMHVENNDEFKGKLLDYFHFQKLFFKNPAFSSEHEYRFVLKVDNNFNEDLDSENNPILKIYFRIGTSGIITPFIEWKFDLNDKERLFKQITLAPMIEPSLAEESFKRFLAATVRQNIEIKKSSIKLRF